MSKLTASLIAMLMAGGLNNAHATSYSIDFSGPNSGSMGPSSSANYQAFTANSRSLTSFWDGCPIGTSYNCYVMPDSIHSQLVGIGVGSPWSWMAINLMANERSGRLIAATPIQEPFLTYENARLSGDFTELLLASDLAMVSSNKAVGSRINVSGPEAYVSVYSPYVVTANWTTSFDTSGLPIGDIAFAETFVSASLVVYGRTGTIIQITPSFYSSSIAGSGSGSFTFDAPTALANVTDWSTAIIRMSFEQRLDVAAANVPEPETYTMLLTGLSVMGVLGRRRKKKRA